MKASKKVYQHLDKLPTGHASDIITDGCLVLEGGGWKGLYTVGVLDCMMENDINLSSVVGVSAGALSA
ncbi:MAG: patatin-like phospholipase family protein, partial [Ruminococcus sp.]|nr:patatin-like phospholipase family protein [Ruminococcus sp.]